MAAAAIAITASPYLSPPPSPPADVCMVQMEPDEVICTSEDTTVIETAPINYAMRPTSYPGGDHSLLKAVSHLFTTTPHHIDWAMDDERLSALQPPPSPPHGAHCALKRKECYLYTEVLGKYLIERGFPLIGIGRYTLAFLLTENKVAKVARYCRSVDPAMYEYHRHERNLDVRHYQNHPAAFACTTYHLVMPVLPGKNRSWFDYTAWRHDLYVQELIRPLARKPDFHAPSFMETYPNWRRVIEMLNANPLTPFNQWGLTDSNMLVGYDYH